jgi:putative spermidine/putrescine transport system ATP-binding protein
VMVTQDQDEALTLADRILVMRDGRLEQVGTPAEVYQHPATRFVAGFLGVSNFFQGTIEGRVNGSIHVGCPNGVRLTIPVETAPSGSATVALRPEAIRVSPGTSPPTRPNAVMATLEQAVYRGFMVHYYMRLPGGEPLIAFQQNTGNGVPVGLDPGLPVLAEWDGTSNRLVRDEG